MRFTAPLESAPKPVSLARRRASDIWELTKPRIALLVLFTTLAGFYLGSRGALDFARLFHTLLGTALTAGGAGALNMLLEREADGRMRRTMNRPLPAGRLQPAEALKLGVTLSVAGVFYFAAAVNLLTSLLAALTLISYLLVYTPLKTRTWLSTLVGAAPGALPPLGGWAAARGSLSLEAWTLFAIVCLWQMPHFFALAWMYREDYLRGGFPMLTTRDPDGRRTAAQIVLFSLALIPASLAPALLGMAGLVYLIGACALGLGFLGYCARFAAARSNATAKQFFRVSVLYLPLLLALIMINKTG